MNLVHQTYYSVVFSSYGARGKAIITRFIYNITPQLENATGVAEAVYQDYPNVVDNIFLADVAAALISEDYGCSLEEGFRLAWLSEQHGAIEFPEFVACPALKMLHDAGCEAFRDAEDNQNEAQQMINDKQVARAARKSKNVPK